MIASRLAYYAGCTLALAVIAHITIILMIPAQGSRDAFALLSRQTELMSFQVLDEATRNIPLIDVDPFFAYGVCRFDLSRNGVHLNGRKIDSFWSATVVDDNGTVVYSLNSRTAIDTKLDLILLDPVQILRMRELQPVEAETSIIVEAEITQGFVLLRVLRPDASWNRKAQAFLESVSCNAYEPQPAASLTEDPADSPAEGNENEPIE
jgi:uncharacterized membrane protein